MSRLYDYLSMGPFVQVILETKGTILKIHKACLIKRVQKCASPYDFHWWRTPPIPGGWQCLIPQVLLTRIWIQDVVVYYLRRPRILSLANPVSNQNHKVLCRAIGQGITLARG